MLLPLPRIAAIPADFTVDPELSARFRRRVYIMNGSIIGLVALLPAVLFFPIHGVALGCLIGFFPGMLLLTQTLRCPKCRTQPRCRVSLS